MRKKAKLVIVGGALTIAALWTVACIGCPSEVFTEIGEFESRDDALHASIPRLAAEIRRCPHAQTYRIVFTDAVDRHALLYYRTEGSIVRIGYEDDVHSGYKPGDGPYEVNDEVVQAVAERGGSLNDFAQYDHEHKQVRIR